MKQQKEVALMSPENGQKMLQMEERVNGELKTYLLHHINTQEADLIARANMALYNLAQSRGISLWKLCFEVMPRWEAAESSLETKSQDGYLTMNIDYELRLVPIEIDWEHGPSYWEKKYRDLKKRMTELLKDKED